MLHTITRPCSRRLASSAPCTPLPLPLSPSALLPSRIVGWRAYRWETPPVVDVGILGGGITGLATAYFLTRENPAVKVTLYEARDRVGGWLESRRVPVQDGTVLFEAGPRSLRPQGNGVLTARLMQELDLANDAIFTQTTSPAARNRYIYYPDHLVRMPNPAFGLVDNIWSLLAEPVFHTAIWSGPLEVWKKGRDPSVQDESIGDFFSRRLSKTMVDRILSAIIHGIYAGDVWQLSAKSLFPKQWRDEALHGSIFLGMLKSRTEGIDVSTREADFFDDMKSFAWDPLLTATLKHTSVFTFREGISMLSDRLHAKLIEAGQVEFQTGTAIQHIALMEGDTGMHVTTARSAEPRTHSHIISALSPAHLNTVMGIPFAPRIPTVNVMTVNLYFRTPNLHAPGFGYLIPHATPFENNPERALGVVFDTGYSPSTADIDPQNWLVLDAAQIEAARDAGQRINVNDFAWYNVPHPPNVQDRVQTRGTKVTVMLGGHWWDGWPAFPDEKQGLALARSVLERHLGIKEEPEAWQAQLNVDCIPQYAVGHEQKLQSSNNFLYRQYGGRLRVAGNWMSGVGVNDCLRSAYEVAKNLCRGRRGTGLEHIGEELTVRLEPGRSEAWLGKTARGKEG